MDVDHFNGLFKNRITKLSFAFADIFLYAIDLLLLYGIIWYERYGNDQVW